MRTLRRIPFRVVVPVLLIAVLAVLAALQYRWLGQVSQAERQRMHETMTSRVRLLANDIDRELSRLYATFQLREPGASHFDTLIAERYKLWRETARHQDLIAGVYVVSGTDASLQKFDPATGVLSATEWPTELEPIRERTLSGRVNRVPTTPGPSAVAFRLPPMVSTDPLAVSVVIPVITHFTRNGVFETRVAAPSSLLIALNEAKFTGEVLPQLVTQHLGDSLDDYRVSIVHSRAPQNIVYASTTDWVLTDPEQADVRVDALAVRGMLTDRMAAELRLAQTIQRSGSGGAATGSVASPGGAGGTVGAGGFVTVAPAPPPPSGQAERYTMVIEQPRTVQPSVRPGTPDNIIARSGGSVALGTGGWQVLLKHRAGSLEAAVQHVRRRNLLMSFGMLALLASSVGLVLVSARRAERLAAQQMDFVATVSHELRTPLAVIRSAGQNLAAGVVQDPKRYGELIETEGRRLTDMVEQTLALAGLSGERKVAQTPVDAGDLVRAVVAAPETATRADGVAFDIRIAEELPLVLADEMLLRRGVQNLVGNALKYGAGGGWIGITVDAAGSRRGREVRITVADRGPGVAADDLPHIFEAFYRGKKAVADQVQGNGLGLHLVKRIAEAHGGRVTVRTAPGDGAAFTLHIPARGDLAMHTIALEQTHAS